jgi:hypothetical protein
MNCLKSRNVNVLGLSQSKFIERVISVVVFEERMRNLKERKDCGVRYGAESCVVMAYV